MVKFVFRIPKTVVPNRLNRGISDTVFRRHLLQLIPGYRIVLAAVIVDRYVGAGFAGPSKKEISIDIDSGIGSE